jgi:hypothetical protein
MMLREKKIEGSLQMHDGNVNARGQMVYSMIYYIDFREAFFTFTIPNSFMVYA